MSEKKTNSTLAIFLVALVNFICGITIATLVIRPTLTSKVSSLEDDLRRKQDALSYCLPEKKKCLEEKERVSKEYADYISASHSENPFGKHLRPSSNKYEDLGGVPVDEFEKYRVRK